ncbi:MAG: biotin/lipoyl-containing protein, partial [Pseudomonadota bacterium]
VEHRFTGLIERDGPEQVTAEPGEIDAIALADATGLVSETHLGWLPGQTLATVHGPPVLETDADGITTAVAEGSVDMVLKVEERTEGFRIRYRGADLDVKVRSPRRAALAALMPVKEAADTSKLLLCPMPGTVVSISVAEGEEVQEGQALCTVEAMKMENVLRAARKGKVSKINVAAGAGLSVDDIIMEFE